MTEAMPTPDPDKIAHLFEPQFDAAQAFLHTIWRCAPRRGRDELEMLLLNILGRSMTTYRALLHLLHGGSTEQGWMLIRSLFEDLVFAYWCALPANRVSAAAEVAEHAVHTNERIAYLQTQLAAGGLSALANALDPQVMRLATTPLAGKLHEKVNEIERLWEGHGGSVAELHAQHKITYWRSNLALHTSGQALTSSLTRGSIKLSAGTRVFQYGQTKEIDEADMLLVFEMGTFPIGWLTRLVLAETGLPLSELEAAFASVKRSVRVLTPAQRRKLGRNDPCWCASGKKLKHCHAGSL